MAKTTADPITDAKTQLQQLEDDRWRWDTAYAEATTALADLSKDRGRRLVDGDTDADALVAEEARHRSRIANAEAAMAELDRRIATARGHVVAAYVAVLEERQAPHRRALDDHRTAVGELLSQLEDLDAVPYRPMDPDERAREQGALDATTVTLTASRTDVLRLPVNDLQGRIDTLAGYVRDLDADEYAAALAKADRALTGEVREPAAA